MKIRWSPDDGSSEPAVWDFDPRKLLVSEIEAIEKVTGQTFGEWGENLDKGGVSGLRALVWVLRKRNGEADLRYRDVDFPIGWVETERDDDEDEPADDEEDDEDDGPKSGEAPSLTAVSG